MAIKPEILTEIFVNAEAQELGLVVKTNNAHGLEVKLAAHRKEAGLWPDLMILRPSTEGILFICHRSVELDP